MRKKLGVDIDNLLISQPDAGEQALEICRHAGTLRRHRRAGDRFGRGAGAEALNWRGKWATPMSGLQARLMSQALRKLTGSISTSSKTIVIFINQIRMKIGVMFGSPETTTGGNALKFYASVRLDIRRIGSIKDRDERWSVTRRA